MPIPEFLSPVPVQLATAEAGPERSDAPPPAADRATGGAPPEARKLGFSIESQEHGNWCWSAVGVSVERFYNRGSTRTQCGLANTVLGRNDCCAGGANDPEKCNTPWYLDRALAAAGNLESVEPGDVTFGAVRTRIDAASPLCCRIGWFGGGGHFAAIVGWRVAASGTQYIDVADPIWMESEVAYDGFPSSYQTGGNWTHTYFTAPATAGGAVVASASASDPATLGG